MFTVNDALIKLAAARPAGRRDDLHPGAVHDSFSRRGWLCSRRPVAFGRSAGTAAHRVAQSGEIVRHVVYLLPALFHMPMPMPRPFEVCAAGHDGRRRSVLGEPVGWRRWPRRSSASSGCLIIIRPGTQGFNVWSLAALAAVGRVVPAISPRGGIEARARPRCCRCRDVERCRSPRQRRQPGSHRGLGWCPAAYVVGHLIAALACSFSAVISSSSRRSGRRGRRRFAVPLFRDHLGDHAGLFGLRRTARSRGAARHGIVTAAGLYTFFRERQLRLERGTS